MNVKINDLMTESVIVARPHKSIDYVRGLMESNKIGAIPLVDNDGKVVGIVSATDLILEHNGTLPVSTIMTEKVYTIPKYDDVSAAARLMLNHKVHHVVVTNEKKIAGVLSTFDLLKLVDGHRFTIKNAPTQSKRKGSKRV